MNSLQRILASFAAAAMTLLFAGCNTVSIQSKQYLGLPQYPPTDPATVQILRQIPQVPNVKIGEISAEPEGNPTVQAIEQKLRTAAAAMGANAVVIVVDRTMVTGATVLGGPFWGGASIVPDTGRVIIGVAIRFTP
ncbi:MAG: hypothetical protein U1G08_21370 [Verrucomicrobiota bacterium]